MKDQKITVTFKCVVPADATPEQVGEWLEFFLHANGQMDGKNPLADHEPEALPFSVSFS